MTTTIAETRIRAQVQEYDGVAYVYIETRTATAWEWKRVATFSHDSQHEALDWAREAGWTWLVGAEGAEPQDEPAEIPCECGNDACGGCDRNGWR
jgi:hypothetical protein